MIRLFEKIFHDEKKLILVQMLSANQSILAELRAIKGDSKLREGSIHQEVAQMSKGIEGLTKMIDEMVSALSKYFKIELEFMEKEKEKMAKKPTAHDRIF